MKQFAVVLFILIFAAVAGAQTPTVYVDGPEDFSTALTAALNKSMLSR